MQNSSKIVIVGAGVFGLTTARQLALEGFEKITVLDRHMVPVPDGSSSNISRMVQGKFFPASFVLIGSSATAHGHSWLDKTTAALMKHKLPCSKIDDAQAARRSYPTLSGELASPGSFGYNNKQAGWADASKAVIQLRDECIELGVSFTCARAGTVEPLMYANFCAGWFNFPPHAETRLLKFAIHGWGYTRAPETTDHAPMKDNVSSPPLASRAHPNFVPGDGELRLRRGLREMLPELADRPFEKTALCWYTDTPSGDFIMDYHPDYTNLFVGGAGSGHAFKFLPVLGECMAQDLKKQLPEHLAEKWRFRTEYKDDRGVFLGDGSTGGPVRRELDSQEKARL
ncbi:hypothetical protein PMIN03_001725 [Paraphaeosphaeria minitans]|uniref:Sarcosine oxidase n=1 Tax=Paraphaeosphaeria minitans TaxID=565426 RepID=A0A9P6GPR3_9PLEO|nr:sarcosine oxidase [Paraphaeosphaeria minitans]